jgi:hypothetical protein
MNTEPLTREFLIRALKQRGTKYVINSDDNIIIQFKRETILGCFNLIAKVTSSGCLHMAGWYELDIPESQLSEAIFLCNEYNNTHTFPNTYVDLPSENNKTCNFWCQTFFDLEEGIHIDGLINFISSAVAGAAFFEKWITEEKHFGNF